MKISKSALQAASLLWLMTVLSELLGQPLDDGAEYYLKEDEYEALAGAHLTHSSIEQARQVAKKYWKM